MVESSMIMDNKKMMSHPPTDRDHAKYTSEPYNPFKDVPTSSYTLVNDNNGIGNGLGKIDSVNSAY